MVEPLSDNDIFAAERIENQRTRKGAVEYLIKWKGWPSRFNSWEPDCNILDNRLVQEYADRKAVGSGRRGRKPVKRKYKRQVSIPSDSDSSDESNIPAASASRPGARGTKGGGRTGLPKKQSGNVVRNEEREMPQPPPYIPPPVRPRSPPPVLHRQPLPHLQAAAHVVQHNAVVNPSNPPAREPSGSPDSQHQHPSDPEHPSTSQQPPPQSALLNPSGSLLPSCSSLPSTSRLLPPLRIKLTTGSSPPSCSTTTTTMIVPSTSAATNCSSNNKLSSPAPSLTSSSSLSPADRKKRHSVPRKQSSGSVVVNSNSRGEGYGRVHDRHGDIPEERDCDEDSQPEAGLEDEDDTNSDSSESLEPPKLSPCGPLTFESGGSGSSVWTSDGAEGGSSGGPEKILGHKSLCSIEELEYRDRYILTEVSVNGNIVTFVEM